MKRKINLVRSSHILLKLFVKKYKKITSLFDFSRQLVTFTRKLAENNAGKLVTNNLRGTILLFLAQESKSRTGRTRNLAFAVTIRAEVCSANQRDGLSGVA